MKKSVVRLLIGLLSLAMAWNLGHLAAELVLETSRQQALKEAAENIRQAQSRLSDELKSLSSDSAVIQTLRRRGFISKGDIVFFDGG